MERQNQNSAENGALQLGAAALAHAGRKAAIVKAFETFGRFSGISELPRQTFIASLVVPCGYYLGAVVGRALTFHPHAVSVLWPPNSILLAALLLTPARIWWILILAALPVHVFAELEAGVPIRMALCWFISNCCEVLISAGMIRLLLPGPLRFDSMRRTWIFFVCGGFIGPLLSTFIDAGFVVANAFGPESFWEIWRMRLVSNVMAALIIVPVIVGATPMNWAALRKTSGKRRAEALFLTLVLCAVSISVFCKSPGGTWTTPIFVYVPLPFLVWAAVRFGPRASSTGILGLALLVIWGAVHQLGPFASSSPEESALSMQLFFIVISVTLLSLAVELNERRRFQLGLQQSEELYREVVDSHTDFICRYTADTTLTFVNESYCRYFHADREQLLGRKFLELVPESSRPAVLQRLHTIATAGAPASFEHEVWLPDGSVGWHSWTDYPVRGDNTEIVEFQGIGRDITERKRAEQARQDLTHTSRLVLAGELTAMVAHEINQPLGAILSNTEAAEMLLESPQLDVKELQGILADIRKDNLRANDAINRIRTLLRKRPIEMLPMDLNEVALEVLQMVSGDALLRRVDIEKELSPMKLPITGDKVHLQQVLINLVLNAMDATSQHSGRRMVRVSTSLVERENVQITVQDNGPGIPADKISNVFDLFFTTKKQGMGVGLAVARSIVDAHGGRIWAENSQAGGARFHCQIPMLASNSKAS